MDVAPPPFLNLRFILSAALVAVGIRLAAKDPVSAALAVVLVAVMVVPSLVAQKRVREVLRSGDVRSVLHAWSSNIAAMPHPETMGPLITAAAFASCGWVEQARTALDRSVRGPIWEAAIEHRLFVETLLDAFEGDREGALQKASRLAALPMPPAGRFVKGRVRVLRGALSAFARAFAHASQPGDLQLLERASKKSPLVHWAMRYAAAVVAIDHGDPGHAKKLIEAAPAWPDSSAFRVFHEELSTILGAA